MIICYARPKALQRSIKKFLLRMRIIGEFRILQEAIAGMNANLGGALRVALQAKCKRNCRQGGWQPTKEVSGTRHMSLHASLNLKLAKTVLQLGTLRELLQDGKRGREATPQLCQEEERMPRDRAALLLPFAEVVLRVLAAGWRMLGSAVLLLPFAKVVQGAPVSLA